jgi:TonB family protein
MRRWLAGAVLFTALGITVASAEDPPRKARSRAEPTYPVLAKKMRIAGVVKIEVTIAPSGMIRAKRVIGGNPVLVTSCMDALNKWRFEPGPREDTQILEFRFGGSD